MKHIAEWLCRKFGAPWQPLAADSAGFFAGAVRTEWNDVRSISAFKRDRVSVDDVWFELETVAGSVMVCEEQPGFNQWESALCNRFPSAAGWRHAVIQPPFAESFTVLYRQT